MQNENDIKCIINGCENRQSEGTFFGNICGPCFIYLVSERVNNSQAFRNEKQILDLRQKITKAIANLWEDNE